MMIYKNGVEAINSSFVFVFNENLTASTMTKSRYVVPLAANKSEFGNVAESVPVRVSTSEYFQLYVQLQNTSASLDAGTIFGMEVLY